MVLQRHRVASRAISWASVPRWQLICGALVIRSSSSLKPASTAPRGWKGGGGTAWPSTLLGPEGTGVKPSLGPEHPTRVMRWCVHRDRPYLENCTVDASINCSRQVNKGTRWMPWHQEPKKDVGACDKPREVGNQTLIRGFPNRET